MKKLLIGALILALVLFIGVLLIKPRQVGVVLFNERLDCDIEGAHFRIVRVFEIEDSALVHEIVLPRFNGDQEIVRRQYDSLYSPFVDSTQITVYAIGSYSLFRHYESSYGCTGAHSFTISKILKIERSDWK